MTSQTLPPEIRILDASKLSGPDSLADILGFLSVDQYISPVAPGPATQAGASDSPSSGN